MKIAIAPGDLQGSGYYRGVVPGLGLKRAGHDVFFTNRYNDTKLAKADAFMCMRVSNTNEVGQMAGAFREFCKTHIVHDLDDNYHVANPVVEWARPGTPQVKSIDEFNRLADVVSVSTPDLVDTYRKDCPRIVINYNALDDLRFEQNAPDEITGEPKRADQIRIGWAGSPGRDIDFKHIIKPLQKILDEYPQVRIVFLGDDLRRLFATTRCGCSLTNTFGFRPCAHHSKQLEYGGRTRALAEIYKEIRVEIDYDSNESPVIKYYELLNDSDFDIGIVATAPSVFSKCKSYLKLLEYGMCGIPAIAPDHGPYRQYVDESTDEVTLLAKTEADWVQHLRSLIEDADARRRLARNNFNYVAKHHLISQKVRTWEDTFSWAAGLLQPA